MDEQGRYDVSIPQSRIELLIHQMIKNEIEKIKPDPEPEQPAATEEDIDGIIDNIFPDD